MAVNKVIYGNNTLVDLTNDTATEDDVLEGVTFHDKSGVLKTGRLSVPVKDVQVDGESVVNNQGIAEIDMSGYYTDDEVDTLLAEKADISDIPVLPTADEQTSTTGEFETVTGGLLGECIVSIKPVQSGSGDPSPTNIRPISGHTQADVEVVGKNRLDISSYVQKPWNGDETNLTRARGEHAIPTKVGVTYTVSVSNDFLSKYRYAVLQMSSDFPASTLSGDSSWKSTNSYTFTSLTEYIGINVRRIDYEAIDLNDLKQMQVQIELGSTATEYVAYNKSSKTYSTPFGQTVYGGTLDVLTGELTIDRYYTQITAQNVTYNSINNRGLIRTNIVGIPTVVARINGKNCICDKFESLSQNEGVVEGTVGIYANGQIIAICGYKTSLEDYQSWLTDNPVTVVYEIETPQTIQLTPQTVKALVGKNYVDAPLDGQSIVEVKFKQLMNIDDIENIVEEIDAGTVITGTLTAGATSVTLSNSKITTNSMIDIYTTVYGLNPTNVTVSNGQIVLTFEAQQSNVGVKVRVS